MEDFLSNPSRIEINTSIDELLGYALNVQVALNKDGTFVFVYLTQRGGLLVTDNLVACSTQRQS